MVAFDYEKEMLLADEMSKQDIKDRAVELGFYDIYEMPGEKEKIKTAYVERLQMAEELRTLSDEDLVSIAKESGIRVKGPRAKVEFTILSGGRTPEEVEGLLAEEEVKEEERIERAEAKWEHVTDLAEKLPDIRERYHEDLKQEGLPRDKVLAAVIALIDETKMRIGSERGVEKYGTFGASTITPGMLSIDNKKKTVTFNYTGKDSVPQTQEITDPVLFAAIKELYEENKTECSKLFCFVEDGEHVPIEDGMVRQYLKKIAGKEHTPHQFRYLHASQLMEEAIAAGMSYSEAIMQVAMDLGHKRKNPKTGEYETDIKGQTAEKSYILPEIVDMYGKGRTERNPVYFEVNEVINKETKTSKQRDRGEILDFLREHPKSKAWSAFLQ